MLSDVPTWIWLATVAGLLAIVILDLVVIARRQRQVTMRDATLWVLVYVGLALAFAAGLWVVSGTQAAGEFVAGYVTEYSLSVDNLFVFMIIMARFGVPALAQDKVLYIGIVVSMVLRAVCIAAGAAALAHFNWVFYVFGAFLVYTAVKLLLAGENDDEDFHEGRVLRLARRVLPLSPTYAGTRLAVREADGHRRFTPLAPDRLWVADFTYVSTWSGWCYTAFVIDAYARRILGWSVATTMTSQLVVDAVEQAVWTRGREGKDLTGLIAHHDHGVQYMSVAYSERLDAAGIKPSTGAVGSSYDNALAESVIGLYKTELVKPQRPWKGLDDLEIATAEWVDWFNHRRPFEYCDDLTPVEAEAAHYAHHQTPTPVGVSN